MAKTCFAEECNYPVWGKGYCQRHQYLRTDKKPKELQKTPLKPISAKGRVRKAEEQKLTLKDKEFFAEIWGEREHVCFESGKFLGNEPLTVYFHHVLPKKSTTGGYPQYRYKKWNIVLLSFEHHSKAEVNDDFVPKVKAYKEKIFNHLNSNLITDDQTEL